MKPLLLFLCGAFAVSAAELKITNTNTGIEIGTGSLGSFTLTYPEFEPAHKAIEVKAEGTQATIKYQDGAECVVSASKDEISVSFKWRIARGRTCWPR